MPTHRNEYRFCTKGGILAEDLSNYQLASQNSSTYAGMSFKINGSPTYLSYQNAYEKLRADCIRCWNLYWLVADCTHLRAIVRSWPLPDAFLHAGEFVATQSNEASLSRVPNVLISVSLVEVGTARRESVLSNSRTLRGNFFESLTVIAYRYFQNEWNLELRSWNVQKTGGKVRNMDQRSISFWSEDCETLRGHAVPKHTKIKRDITHHSFML
jgi:hypothetical protein